MEEEERDASSIEDSVEEKTQSSLETSTSSIPPQQSSLVMRVAWVVLAAILLAIAVFMCDMYSTDYLIYFNNWFVDSSSVPL